MGWNTFFFRRKLHIVPIYFFKDRIPALRDHKRRIFKWCIYYFLTPVFVQCYLKIIRLIIAVVAQITFTVFVFQGNGLLHKEDCFHRNEFAYCCKTAYKNFIHQAVLCITRLMSVSHGKAVNCLMKETCDLRCSLSFWKLVQDKQIYPQMVNFPS